VIARGALVLAIAACGDPAAHVQLAPVNPCGSAAGATGLRVIAYTAGGEVRRAVAPSETAEIDAFPGDTEQLGVEVLGNAGNVIATGKTGPIDFAGLADKAQIPIVMAPLGGFCPTAAQPRVARTAPAVARAGDGVLIVGGTDGSGMPLASAEYYDAATATCADVTVPGAFDDPVNGFAGVALAELPDGTVAITGTAHASLAYFDPATLAISAPLPFDVRAFHAAFATDQDHLLVMGGCAEVAAGACSGPLRRESYEYDLRDLAQRARRPTLGPTETREGGQIFDLGVQADGARRFVLATSTGEGDRFAAADDTTEALTGLHTQTVALDGSALLSADGSGAVQLPPGGAPVALTPPPAAGALVALEDGSVLSLGDQVARYVPTTNAWMPGGTPPASLTGATLARLPDGSVLVLASDKAWIYRPSLIGPQSGQVVAAPDGSQQGILTVPDPTTLTRTPGHLVLAGDRARVLVGGPRFEAGQVSATAMVMAGGVGLIAQQTGPGRAIVGRLVPGEPAKITRADGTSCTGAAVTAADLAQPVSLAVHGQTATLAVGAVGGATTKVSCDLPDAGERGAWGLEAAGSGAQIDVGPVTVTRTR
jgi:hypothetical protein